MRRVVVAMLSALVAFAVGSCGADSGDVSEPTTTPSEEQVRAIAENMLTAYNSGDYAAFTRDWSSAMKRVITVTACSSL